jgi:hypothetical protein
LSKLEDLEDRVPVKLVQAFFMRTQDVGHYAISLKMSIIGKLRTIGTGCLSML